MRTYGEMLAVVSMSVLMLLSLGAARIHEGAEEDRRRICAGNLRALHLAFAAYAEDQDGYIPAVVTRLRPKWKFWYDTLQRFCSSPADFYCPANSKAEAGLDVDEGELDLLPQVFDEGSESYGMNYWLSASEGESAVLHRMAELARPGHTVLLGDSRGPFLRATKWCWKEDYSPLHFNASNFIMADGHVELMDHENLGLVDGFENWKADRRRWIDWRKRQGG